MIPSENYDISHQLVRVKNELSTFQNRMQTFTVTEQDAEEMLQSIATRITICFKAAQIIVNTRLRDPNDSNAKYLEKDLKAASEIFTSVREYCVEKGIDALHKKVQVLCQNTPSKIPYAQFRAIQKSINVLTECSPSATQVERLRDLKMQMDRQCNESQCPSDSVVLAPAPLTHLGVGLYGLPNELFDACLSYCDSQEPLREVDSRFNAANNAQLFHYWLQLKQSPPTGLLDIASVMDKIEKTYSNKTPLVWFKALQHEFAKEGITLLPGKVYFYRADYEALQRQVEQKYADQALLKMGTKISPLLHLNDAANTVRAWMNDPANAARLNAVTDLDLDGLDLRVLPPEMQMLTQLRNLHLNCNKLIVLPDWIGNLTRLQSLNLFGNALRALPDSIGKLTNLMSLQLQNNLLTTLPETISNLINLIRLPLNGNPITSLPFLIGRLTNLRGLHLDYSVELTSLPASFGNLVSLEMLCQLNFTNLVDIPDPVLNSKNPKISNSPEIKERRIELAYPCKSPLAKLYQAVLQNKSKEELRNLFSALSLAEKQHIFTELWPNCPKDLQWKEQHAIDDRVSLYRALRRAIDNKYDLLFEKQKTRLYQELTRIFKEEEGFEPGFCWEYGAKLHLPRLADAMQICFPAL